GSAQRPAPPVAVTAAAERPEQAAKATAAAPAAAPAPAAASASQVQAGETAPAAATAGATEEKAEIQTGEDTTGVVKGTGPSGPDAAVSDTEATTPAAAVAKDDAVTAEPGRGPSTAEAGPPTVDEAVPAEGTEAAVGVPADVTKYQETPGPNVEVPHEQPQPRALEPTENADEVYADVLKEQLDKGSSPQVAEARAKVARVKAERGIKRGPTPVYTPNLVPSAPTQGHEDPSVPSGAPTAAPPEPDSGPVAPTAEEEPAAGATPTTSADPQAAQPPAEPAPAEAAPVQETEDPEAAYERVLAEERAKGSSDPVATGRAKAARVRAQKARGSA
ncbi:MAG TPA: hypothetical protein VHV50_05110, partial [Actinomycetota bacterium]|nr:hypothetical protein [Actinomycetota bacterium]